MPLVLSLMLLVGYLASVGPLYGLHDRGMLDTSTYETIFETVYFPLMYVVSHSEFFEEHPVGLAYVWYVELWAF